MPLPPRKPRRRYKYTTTRQWGGDDGYCWAVFYKDRPNQPIVCGLMKSQVPYYRDRFEDEEIAKHESSKSTKPSN